MALTPMDITQHHYQIITTCDHAPLCPPQINNISFFSIIAVHVLLYYYIFLQYFSLILLVLLYFSTILLDMYSLLLLSKSLSEKIFYQALKGKKGKDYIKMVWFR